MAERDKEEQIDSGEQASPSQRLDVANVRDGIASARVGAAVIVVIIIGWALIKFGL